MTTERPNILFILSDQHNAKVLGQCSNDNVPFFVHVSLPKPHQCYTPAKQFVLCVAVTAPFQEFLTRDTLVCYGLIRCLTGSMESRI